MLCLFFQLMNKTEYVFSHYSNRNSIFLVFSYQLFYFYSFMPGHRAFILIIRKNIIILVTVVPLIPVHFLKTFLDISCDTSFCIAHICKSI